MRWFEQHRLEWIAETVRVFGFINRQHICRKFNVSEQQASSDLKQFQAAYPGLITYNTSAKKYEARIDAPPKIVAIDGGA